MKTKGFFLISAVMAAAFSALVALLLFSQTTKAYAQATDPPSTELELGHFIFEPAAGVVPVNYELGARLAFTDPGALGAGFEFSWNWGDGTVNIERASCAIITSLSEFSSECPIDNYGVGEISDTHTYEDPGVYALQVTVSDTDGRSESANQYIIAYDPSAGFVTGGGWIDSPQGAYQPDPDLEGKATFGFVSKYKKGAKAPTGSTEFQFHAADLNFHSSSYEWLVVTGSNHARFKGVGTINGEGESKFMLWAGDGEPDTFRIKIWEEDEFGVETVIYDNVLDQAIGGGSIVVHTKN